MHQRLDPGQAISQVDPAASGGQRQVPLVVHRVTLARGGLGVEAHARAARYQAFQGRALGRDGRVQLTRDAQGQVWVGGQCVGCIAGEVRL